MPDLLTAAEAASLLGIKTKSINGLVTLLKLAPVSGRNLETWRFTREAVERRASHTAEVRVSKQRFHCPPERSLSIG